MFLTFGYVNVNGTTHTYSLGVLQFVSLDWQRLPLAPLAPCALSLVLLWTFSSSLGLSLPF